MIKRYTTSVDSNIQTNLETLTLIEKAREAADGFIGCNNFHLKFMAFLDRFGPHCGLFTKVMFSVRSVPSGWKNNKNDEECTDVATEDIRRFNNDRNYIFSPEDEPFHDVLVENRLVGGSQSALSFQLFDFCDYLIVFDAKPAPGNKDVRLLKQLVSVCRQHYRDMQLLHGSARENAGLQRQIYEKEKDLQTTERSLKKRVYEIHNLLEISSELYSILNLNQLINSALLIIVGQMACQKAFTFLYESAQRRFSRRFTKGLDQIELNELSVELDHPLINHFIENAKPLLTEQLKENTALQPIVKVLEENNIDVIAPIMHGERIRGLVGCGASLNKQRLSRSDLEIFSILVNMISISLSNAINYEEVKNLSLTDPMTGLNNYRYFEDRLKEEINRAKRNKSEVSLLMLDIDHFKNYNDTLGHQAGDEALRTLGWLLRNTVREEDIVSRYGGEEFCIILPGSEKEVIDILGERIRQKVEEYPFYKETVQPGGRISISIGGATFPDDADNFEDLVHKADLSLYKSKSGGRNRVTVYTESI